MMEGKKKCPKCKAFKNKVDEFYVRKNRNNELSGYCKVCVNECAKERQRRLKIRAVEFLGGECEMCGIVGHPSIYDFHHKNPKEKDFNVGSKNIGNFEKIKDELMKCMLLCANCHRIVHYSYKLVLSDDKNKSAKQKLNEVSKETICDMVCCTSICEAAKNLSVSSATLKKFLIEAGLLDKVKNDKRYDPFRAAKKTKISWPKDSELLELVKQTNFSVAAKKLGVSDNAIRKRLRKLGIIS